MKNIRNLMFSCLVIMVCIATIAAGTYALFSTSVKIENHLQAGTVKAELYRVDLVKKVGTNAEESDSTEINLTTTQIGEPNVFGLTSTDLIAPGNYFRVRLQVKNVGTLAFVCSEEIVFDQASKNTELYKQIETSLYKDNNGAMSTEEIDAVDVAPMGQAGDSVYFWLELKFIDKADNSDGTNDNNLAQAQSVKFDLVIKAIQKVA